MRPDNDKLERLLTGMEFDDEPSPAHRDRLQRRLVAALKAKTKQPRTFSSYQWRTIMRTRLIGTAAVLAILVGIVVVMLTSGNGASVAFGDVREAIVSAETISYTQTMSLASGQMLQIRHFAKGTDHWRREIAPLKPDGTPYCAAGPSAIMIADFASRQILALYPEKKEATLEFFGELPPDGHRAGMIPTDLKELLAGKEESLGERRINGTKAVGFRVASGGREIKLWIDPETGAPLLIETSYSDNLPIAIAEIRINEDLPDSLFDLSLPEGYKLRKIDPHQAN